MNTAVKVPDEVTLNAVGQMLATIHSQAAQFEVQQVANDHSDDQVCGKDGRTYAQKYRELADAERRILTKYKDLLPVNTPAPGSDS